MAEYLTGVWTPMSSSDVFRIYDTVGKDGYPPEWHETIKHLVRADAGNRCVRCLHPYTNGAHGNGEWSPCDEQCWSDEGLRYHSFGGDHSRIRYEYDEESGEAIEILEAHWRILTVHHLNGDKADCRWWNLASLCQRCHLRIQRTVVIPRIFPWEHSEWFKPYAAGWYAFAYLGEDLTREETMAQLDELLALELQVPA